MVLRSLRPIVFWLPVGTLMAAVIASVVNFEGLMAVTSAINTWILAHFSVAFSWGTLLFVLSCLWAYFSPLGRVRIGGADAEPILSKWNWFSVTLCTTIAIGILFWATAEPVFHLNGPPKGLGIAPGSAEAAEFAMTSLFMHWSFTPYAIYCVPGLAFALAYYNLGKDYSLSGPLSLVFGPRLKGIGSDIIDALALFALVAGVAASLGAGMMSISGGIAKVTGIANTPLLQGLVTIAIVGAFVISSVAGLQRGIRVLSDINIKFFFGLCLFVFIAGPTLYILESGWQGLQNYAAEFLPRSVGMGVGDDKAWAQDWTVFYWANWLAWAPITALFLGRISRGYTVRQYITVNFFLPSLFAIIWMSIFGGAAMHIDLAEAGVLNEALARFGPESIAYEVLARYPFASLLMAVFVFVSFISYVTAADSNTEAIAGVCQKTPADHNIEAASTGHSTTVIKIILAFFIGAAAYVMTAFSGIDGVRMMSNLGGLPALILVLLMNVVLLLLGTRYRTKLG